MKVLVLGGAGWIGSIIVRGLAEMSTFSEVIIGDIAESKCKQLIDQIRNEKLSFKHVDVTNKSELIKTMKDVDVVVNATWYEFCLKITEAAIAAGVNIVDLGGMPELTLRQLELDSQAKNAGITNVIGCGETPGISNVLAKYGANKLDAINEIRIRDGEIGKSSFCWLQHSVRTSMEELTSEAIIYENGEYKKVPPRTGEERYKFPNPIGEQICYYVPCEEVITFPRFLGKPLKTVDMKVTISPELVRTFDALEKLGVTKREPIKFKGVDISPLDFVVACIRSVPMEQKTSKSYSCIVVDMTGTKDGNSVRLVLSAMMEDYDKWGVDGEGYKTAMPAAIAANMLACNEIKAKGVLPPEACIDPESFLEKLKNKDLKISVEERKIDQ
ncbi:MAG: saccharopine dehydrogenase family protein [Candidatus Baldrarchaeia archaeon]